LVNIFESSIARLTNMSIWFLDIPAPKKLILVLASESPRRLALLKQIGINPVVEVSGYDEKMDSIKGREISGAEFVKDCASNKARAVAERLKSAQREYDLVIGCDTVIEFEGEIFGKPKSDSDAFSMLKRLQSNKHKCMTGLALIDFELNADVSCTETTVEFSRIPDAVLHNYIESGEHRGCAGSYRIQGRAAAFVKGIEGCYHNVVGLPINVLCERMKCMLEKR